MIDSKRIFTVFNYPNKMKIGDCTIDCSIVDDVEVKICIFNAQTLLYNVTCDGFFVDKKNRIFMLNTIQLFSFDSSSLMMLDTVSGKEYIGRLYKDQVVYFNSNKLMIAQENSNDTVLYDLPLECSNVYFLEDAVYCMSDSSIAPIIVNYFGNRDLVAEGLYLKNTAHEYFVADGVLFKSNCDMIPENVVLSISYIDDVIAKYRPKEQILRLWNELKQILLLCNVESHEDCSKLFYNIARIGLIDRLYKNRKGSLNKRGVELIKKYLKVYGKEDLSSLLSSNNTKYMLEKVSTLID